MERKEEKPCVFFLPVNASGNLIPMVEAAKRLLQCTNNSFSVTFLLMHPPPSCTTAYLRSIHSLGLPIRFHQLPYVDPAAFNIPKEFNSLYTRLHLPHIKSVISSSPSPPSALVLDLFATAAIDVAKELNIPSYIYFTSTLTFLNLMLHLPTLVQSRNELDFWETDKELCIPGIAPVPALSVPKPLMSSKLSSFNWFVHHARRYTKTKGIIVNSCTDLEPKVMEALATARIEVFPVGPIISLDDNGSKEHECLKWLDEQPVKSVVFLCFGNRGAFDLAQVDEIAVGLERSGCRFLWILKTDANLEELLSEGFMERTMERGMVWPNWVPQTEILAHPAVGAFVTHCGWNSILESLWFGVPMIPWPIFAEQHLNAFEMVTEMCRGRLENGSKE